MHTQQKTVYTFYLWYVLFVPLGLLGDEEPTGEPGKVDVLILQVPHGNLDIRFEKV